MAHKFNAEKINAFLMGKYELTFDEWDACVDDGGCTYRPDDQGWGRARRPVINVSTDDFEKQYIPWLNRKTGKEYRYPSANEWYYAAQAGRHDRFILKEGDPKWCDYANGANSEKIGTNRNWACIDGFNKKTAPVGSYLANEFGLHDMYGNVWEQARGCFVRSPKGSGSIVSIMTGKCDFRFPGARGGSWSTRLPPNFYLGSAPSFRDSGTGFRLARDLDDAEPQSGSPIANLFD